MQKLSLGISSFYHDSAAAVVDSSKILAAAHEERFTRKKGDSRFPKLAIEKLMLEINASNHDIATVGYYELPRKKFNRILSTQISEAPKGWRQTFDVAKNINLDQFRINKILKDLDIYAPVYFYSHHESHAASAFFPSGFEEAAILTIDGVGEWATATVGVGKGNEIKILTEMRFPNSIGLLYAAFTTYCGFKVNSGEYKLMGLAPFGEPKFKKVIEEEIVEIFEDGSIQLHMEYFDFTKGLRMFSKKMEKLFGANARHPDDMITKFHCDVASSIQKVLEEILQRCVKFALMKTGKKQLVMAGGVALNCVANSTLREIIDVGNIFIQPAAGDAGGALGAAILAKIENGIEDFTLTSSNKSFKFDHAFLGTSYSNQQILESLKERGLTSMEILDLDILADRVTEIIINGGVVGWFQGRMEYGPRALGARSILADPRNVDMQKRLNVKIKNRESFRPFAPMVLADCVSEWFEWPKSVPTPYMLFTSNVLNKHRRGVDNTFPESGLLTEWVARTRSLIPAVTHVDFSARIQTVDCDNPAYNVLKKFYEKTNVPVLINTSFNVRGEPIVESPLDAIDCFLQTDMDALCIGNYLVEKKQVDNKILDFAKSERKVWALD